MLKYADITTILNDEEQAQLFMLARTIRYTRTKQGKKDNKYVVINQDEAYFPAVLRLMEGTMSDGDDAVYTQIPTRIYLWQNNEVICFDQYGEQIAEYQGKYEDAIKAIPPEYHHLIKRSIDPWTERN